LPELDVDHPEAIETQSKNTVGSTTRVLDWHAGVGLTQKVDDLFFGKAFHHV
jgi:hypothetical protein